MLSAPRNDPLRESRSDARQPCDFAHVGVIEIDALTRQEGTGELRRAPSSLLKATRSSCVARLESNLTRWRVWRVRKQMTNTGTCESQEGQYERGSAIIHSAKLHPTVTATGIKKKRRSREKCLLTALLLLPHQSHSNVTDNLQ